jgi:hypothetical protein
MTSPAPPPPIDALLVHAAWEIACYRERKNGGAGVEVLEQITVIPGQTATVEIP